ncbi:hypothetical protein AYI69_g5048 [Smittium culicis]|uniref:Uncharacterized protein n=1 Tax=Smittium culicis TaxID=133412 RepID=A0A1R1Y8T1_9FUNG|nr:hypothetical protein AYI69_g5048 [Smittium culicis]
MISEENNLNPLNIEISESNELDEEYPEIWDSSEEESSSEDEKGNMSRILGHPSLSKYVKKNDQKIKSSKEPLNEEETEQFYHLGDYESLYDNIKDKSIISKERSHTKASTIYREKALNTIKNIFYNEDFDQDKNEFSGKSETLEYYERRNSPSAGLSLIFQIALQSEENKPFKDLHSAFIEPKSGMHESRASLQTLTEDPKSVQEVSIDLHKRTCSSDSEDSSSEFNLNSYISDEYLDQDNNMSYGSYNPLWNNDTFGKSILGLGYVSKLYIDNKNYTENKENNISEDKNDSVRKYSKNVKNAEIKISNAVPSVIPAIVINNEGSESEYSDDDTSSYNSGFKASYSLNCNDDDLDNTSVDEEADEEFKRESLNYYTMSGVIESPLVNKYNKKQNSDDSFLRELEDLSKPDISLIEMIQLEEQNFVEFKRKQSRNLSKGSINPKNEAQMQFFGMIAANGDASNQQGGLSIDGRIRKKSYFRPVIEDESEMSVYPESKKNTSSRILIDKEEKNVLMETFEMDFYDESVGKVFLSEKDKSEYEKSPNSKTNMPRKKSINISFVLNSKKDTKENEQYDQQRKASIITVDSANMLLHEDIQKNREKLINRTSWIEELDEKLQGNKGHSSERSLKTETLYLDSIENQIISDYCNDNNSAILPVDALAIPVDENPKVSDQKIESEPKIQQNDNNVGYDPFNTQEIKKINRRSYNIFQGLTMNNDYDSSLSGQAIYQEKRHSEEQHKIEKPDLNGQINTQNDKNSSVISGTHMSKKEDLKNVNGLLKSSKTIKSPTEKHISVPTNLLESIDTKNTNLSPNSISNNIGLDSDEKETNKKRFSITIPFFKSEVVDENESNLGSSLKNSKKEKSRVSGIFNSGLGFGFHKKKDSADATDNNDEQSILSKIFKRKSNEDPEKYDSTQVKQDKKESKIIIITKDNTSTIDDSKSNDNENLKKIKTESAMKFLSEPRKQSSHITNNVNGDDKKNKEKTSTDIFDFIKSNLSKSSNSNTDNDIVNMNRLNSDNDIINTKRLNTDRDKFMEISLLKTTKSKKASTDENCTGHDSDKFHSLLGAFSKKKDKKSKQAPSIAENNSETNSTSDLSDNKDKSNSPQRNRDKKNGSNRLDKSNKPKRKSKNNRKSASIKLNPFKSRNKSKRLSPAINIRSSTSTNPLKSPDKLNEDDQESPKEKKKFGFFTSRKN